MNDPNEPSIPTLPPEELASAYLDGELSDESRRAVEADPQLLAMVDTFASARAAVAAPVTGLSEHDRDDLVATAVAAGAVTAATPDTTSADSAGADTAGAGALAPPAPTRISSARQARSRRMVQITAGALAAVAAAGILALVISRDDSGDSTTARSSDSAAEATAEADARAGSGTFEQAGDSSATTAAAAVPGATATDGPTGDAAGSAAPGATESLAGALAALPDLGPLANRNEVIAAARPFATSTPAETPVVCAGYPAPLATATFQGTPAYLVVIEASAAGNRMALVGMDTCTVLVKVDLAAS